MSNISRLTQAGLVRANATLTQADQDVINRLSDDEVSALISVSQKLPADFVSRHFGSAASPAQGVASQSLGIVF